MSPPWGFDRPTCNPNLNTLYNFWLNGWSYSHSMWVFYYVKQIVYFIIFWGKSHEIIEGNILGNCLKYEIAIIIIIIIFVFVMTVVIHSSFSTIISFWIDHLAVVNIGETYCSKGEMMAAVMNACLFSFTCTSHPFAGGSCAGYKARHLTEGHMRMSGSVDLMLMATEAAPDKGTCT